MSKVREEIERLKTINIDDIESFEQICTRNTGTIYKLKQTNEPIAIKCFHYMDELIV